MTMERDSMIFYKEWREAVRKLPTEQRCLVYEAIFDYAFAGIEPKDAIIQALTLLMRRRVDRDKQQYQRVVDRNRANGAKGGRPKKTLETQENPQNPVGNLETQENPQNPNNPDNDNEDKGSKEPDIQHQQVDVFDDAHARKADDAFLRGFLQEQISVELFCMNQGIRNEDFIALAKEVLADWRLTHKTHVDEKDKRQHLINTIRVKIQLKRKESKNNGTTDIYSNGHAGFAERQQQFQQHIISKLNSPEPDEHDISGNY